MLQRRAAARSLSRPRAPLRAALWCAAPTACDGRAAAHARHRAPPRLRAGAAVPSTRAPRRL